MLSLPELGEEIALGRRTRVITKVAIVAGYSAHLIEAMKREDYREAANLVSKLSGIIRLWEIKNKAETMACLKTSARELAGTPEVK